MAEIANPNLALYGQDLATVGRRNAEYPGAPFTDPAGDGTYDDPYLGGNRAGSCAPGIGINTGDVDSKDTDWTLLDQDEAPRNPQFTQHIGGNGFEEGSETGNVIKTMEPAFLDVLALLVADQVAADGAIFHIASGAVNRTGKQVEVGEKVWGVIPT